MERKKVALIIDSKGWAFDNIAHQIKKNLIEYEIDIIQGQIFNGNMIKLFLFCQDYDLIHFLWRGYLSLINREEMIRYIESLGLSFEEFKENYILNKKVTFSVCDQLYLEGEEKWRTHEIMKYADSYFVTSEKLYNIYNQFEKKPKMIIHDGVDLEKYIPQNLERFENLESVRIGWVGNSKFKDSYGNEDLKGLESIIKPAIKELQEEGEKIELVLADRNIKMIPQEEMPNYYNSIDMYICASKTEGTPLTVLEAMATGLPIISTDVGIVKEAFGSEQEEYILQERSKDALKEKVKQLIKNKKYFKILSEENLEKIKKWDWKQICLSYKEFFETNM